MGILETLFFTTAGNWNTILLGGVLRPISPLGPVFMSGIFCVLVVFVAIFGKKRHKTTCSMDIKVRNLSGEEIPTFVCREILNLLGGFFVSCQRCLSEQQYPGREDTGFAKVWYRIELAYDHRIDSLAVT